MCYRWSKRSVNTDRQTLFCFFTNCVLKHLRSDIKLSVFCVCVQVAGGEGLVPAVHEAGLGGHLLRDAGRQRVQHQDGLQRHRDQTWSPG